MELSNTQKAVFSAILVTIIIVMMILAAEGLIRARQYIKYGSFFALTETTVNADTGLKTPTPNMQTKSISINSLGFRGDEIVMPKPAGLTRIAFMGASTTYCAEVSSNQDVWTEIVTARLQQHYPDRAFDSINAGVPGYTVASSLRNFTRRIAALQPDILVIYHGTNDLSSETRDIAKQEGIHTTNLATEQSFMARYSLLWDLVEKNLAIRQLEQSDNRELISLNTDEIGIGFRDNLEKLVAEARQQGVKLVVLVTFSSHVRAGMNAEQLRQATVTAKFYMPYLSDADLLSGYQHYNDIIRDVAHSSGALLIDGENSIPGNPDHFVDSVHFTDLGSLKQAERVAGQLLASPRLQQVIDTTP